MVYQIIWTILMMVICMVLGICSFGNALLGGDSTPPWVYIILSLLLLANPWYNVFTHISISLL